MTELSDSEVPHTEAVDALSKALEAEFPDPVDVFEDELAGRLGFARHPSCPLDQCRRQRVRLIDAAEDEGVAERRAH